MGGAILSEEPIVIWEQGRPFIKNWRHRKVEVSIKEPSFSKEKGPRVFLDLVDYQTRFRYLTKKEARRLASALLKLSDQLQKIWGRIVLTLI